MSCFKLESVCALSNAAKMNPTASKNSYLQLENTENASTVTAERKHLSAPQQLICFCCDIGIGTWQIQVFLIFVMVLPKSCCRWLRIKESCKWLLVFWLVRCSQKTRIFQRGIISRPEWLLMCCAWPKSVFSQWNSVVIEDSQSLWTCMPMRRHSAHFCPRPFGVQSFKHVVRDMLCFVWKGTQRHSAPRRRKMLRKMNPMVFAWVNSTFLLSALVQDAFSCKEILPFPVVIHFHP